MTAAWTAVHLWKPWEDSTDRTSGERGGWREEKGRPQAREEEGSSDIAGGERGEERRGEEQEKRDGEGGEQRTREDFFQVRA